MSKYIGDVSAYAYAVSKGYTGTEEEFAELMADYADVGQRAEDAAESALNSKTAAQTAAQTATTKASEASASATSASGSATAASASASAASGSATSAANSATAANGSATAAAGSATTASTKASEAAQSEADTVIAKNAAEAAQTAAETAQEAAEAAAATFETDTTLTVAGKSADAKATGDAIDNLKEDFDSLRPVKITGKNILVTQPTHAFTFAFDIDKSTFCKAGQTYTYSFESVSGATTWRTTLNVWDANGEKIVETDNTAGHQSAFSVVPSRMFASGIQYNDVYYTESGNGTYRTFVLTFNQDCYVRFGIYFGNTSDSTTVVNAMLEKGNVATAYEPYKAITVLEDVLRIDERFDEIGNYIWADAQTTTQTGKYIPSTGVITDIGSENYVVISCSVTEGEAISITGQAYKNSYYYAFYNANSAFVSGSQATADGTTSIEDVVVTVPYGAATLSVAASSIVPHIKTKGDYIITKVLKWIDKKWTAVGDSLTEVNDRTSINYCDYISETEGINVVNMGVSGSGYMRKHNTNQAFYDRVVNVPTDSDVVTIFGSLNDLTGQTLGTIDDTVSDNTVFGFVNGTLDTLYTAFPAVNLGIISPTPWKSSQPWNSSDKATQYCEGLRQICYNRGIPFLDLYHCSNLRPWDATARDLFYSHDVVDGVNAGCHPDEAGHKMFAPKVKNFLESLLM